MSLTVPRPLQSTMLETTEPQSSLTGAAFDLANAGYTPMPDQEQKRKEER
jgi:hypothetical protein